MPIYLISVILISMAMQAGCSKTPEHSSASEGLLTSNEMKEDLRQYHDAVLNAWSYLDEKRKGQGVDISKSRDALLARIKDDTSPMEFALVLKEFAASLQEGHSEAITSSLPEPFPYSWPIGFSAASDGVFVTNLNYLADNPGVELGDVLQKINGISIEDFLTSRMNITSASTRGARRLLAVDRMHLSDSPTVKLTLLKPGRPEQEFNFQCVSGHIDFRTKSDSKFLTFNSIGESTALIRIPAFAWNAPAFAAAKSDQEREFALAAAKYQIDEAFEFAAKKNRLILDLRNNSGGYELLSIYVAEHLVEGNFHYYTLERRDSTLLRAKPGYREMSDQSFGTRLIQKPRDWTALRHFNGKTFSGQLIVLINERCFSTTDNLCAFLRDSRPNVKFVGQATNGGTGEPAIVTTLKHCGAQIQFCVSRVYAPCGEIIEGSGVQPNVTVAPSRADILAGKDEVLAAAIDIHQE